MIYQLTAEETMVAEQIYRQKYK